MTVSCPIQDPENADLLLAYVDRKLDPELAGRLEQHAQTCPACRRLLDAQRIVWEALDSWQPGPVSPRFDGELMEKIRTVKRRPQLRAAVRTGQVAALFLALLAAMVLRGPSMDSPQFQNQDTLDMQQLEHALDDLEMLRQLEPAGTGESQRPTVL